MFVAPRRSQARQVRTPSDQPSAPSSDTEVPVWDLPTRLFHWALVLAVSVTLGTGLFGMPQRLNLHLLAGGSVAVLLVFRLIWGLVGPAASRFSTALASPRRVLDRLRRADTATYLGHNPLAGAVLFGLLGLLGLLVVTGLVSLGGEEQRGPLAASLSWTTGRRAHGLHELLAWGVIGAVVLHLGGMLIESLHLRENLPAAMVTGLRRRPDAGAVELPALRPRRTLGAVAFVALVLLGGAWLASTWGTAPSGWSSLDEHPDQALFEAECGSCHTLYHPSLLAADEWTLVMQTLDEHFGEDASLMPEPAERITALLIEHGNGTWDTEAANELRGQQDPAEPMAVTSNRWWAEHHRDLEEAALASPDVRSPGNCEACHLDAVQGRFGGHRIDVPRSAQP